MELEKSKERQKNVCKYCECNCECLADCDGDVRKCTSKKAIEMPCGHCCDCFVNAIAKKHHPL